MELRSLGKSGLRVSAIGLGGNTFGETVRDDAAVAVIHRALEFGITFLDTADIYADGRSEELIGRAVAGRRSEAIIATKFGARVKPGTPGAPGSRRWITQVVDDSLRRLKTDYIDLYQVHYIDNGTPFEETLRALDDLVRQGKVLYVGCSNFAAWQLVHVLWMSRQLGLTSMVSVQPGWNLVDGLDDPHLLPACQAFGVGIIPYRPLASGILTGKYRMGEEPPAGTRAGDLEFVRKRLTETRIAAVERLKPWAEARGHTTAELGIAWLLRQPQVSTVIVGARTPEQVERNVAASSWLLSSSEVEEAERIARG